jgi:hypothetical protein
MVWNSVKIAAAGLAVVGTLGVPAVSSAQGHRYASGDRPSITANCDDTREGQVRPASYGTSRAVARRANVQYVEREPERTKTKTALMIGGSAAAGAGVGGALKGTKGAIIGAAIGGGAASIYEAAKRR